MSRMLPRLFPLTLLAIALASCVPSEDSLPLTDNLGAAGAGLGTGGTGTGGQGTGGAPSGTGGQGTGGATLVGTGGATGTGGSPGSGGSLPGAPDGGLASGGRTGTDGGRPDGGILAGSGGAGLPADGGTAAAICTSKVMYKGGNGATMRPGVDCTGCHNFQVAGTVYPTAHEPDNCNGVNGTTGLRVVITGANGQVLTLTPSAAGNFYSNSSVSTPFTVKVTNGAASRSMVTPQTVGGCNSCHTQNGDNNAPGRIMAP
jgi:hypothetical protein